MTTEAYCAAAELCSPNSHEFEAVLAQQEALARRRCIARLQAVLFDDLNSGRIDDSTYLGLIEDLGGELAL
jgi:hypothetical protein